MKTSKKKTSFGEMLTASWKSSEVQLMTFTSQGSPHVHDTSEVALLLSGKGTVIVGKEKYKVSTAGQKVEIPQKTPHYMIPDGEMTMLIYYPNGKQLAGCRARMVRS